MEIMQMYYKIGKKEGDDGREGGSQRGREGEKKIESKVKAKKDHSMQKIKKRTQFGRKITQGKEFSTSVSH